MLTELKRTDWTYVESKEAAKLIRKQLKAHFPGVKFSVTSDYNSINIRYTDGPSVKDVEAVAYQYKGGGFDGMIDLDYSTKSWLMPDGTAIPAHSGGTEGSMGSVPAFDTDRPSPEAQYVQFSCKYISVSRNTSRAHLEAVAAAFEAKYGRPAAPIKGSDDSAYFELCAMEFDNMQDRNSYEHFLQEMVRAAA